MTNPALIQVEVELAALRDNYKTLQADLLGADTIIEQLENELLYLRRFVYKAFNQDGTPRDEPGIREQAQKIKEQLNGKQYTRP